ncbi:unnamed protein product [Cuscuta epithymum]|uniref:Uncharacterized protein n=1 Tax=Cuscuta epithymum TaxID=186058 RepID=A0AAV0CPX8_9ASTE|nr:unnamed protein product [Cuscuta epithymum]
MRELRRRETETAAPILKQNFPQKAQPSLESDINSHEVSPHHLHPVSPYFPVYTAALIQDVLRSNGFPFNLIPKKVSNYNLSETGLLELFLEGPCWTKFNLTHLTTVSPAPKA